MKPKNWIMKERAITSAAVDARAFSRRTRANTCRYVQSPRLPFIMLLRVKNGVVMGELQMTPYSSRPRS